MTNNDILLLLAAAAAVNGLIAGASVFRSLIELPAWKKNQLNGFYEYARVADLRRGLFLYPAFGVGAALIVVAAALAGHFVYDISTVTATLLWISVGLALAHSFTTARAAPNMLRLQTLSNDLNVIRPVFASFKKWHDRRAALQLLSFLSILLTLVSFVL